MHELNHQDEMVSKIGDNLLGHLGLNKGSYEIIKFHTHNLSILGAEIGFLVKSQSGL